MLSAHVAVTSAFTKALLAGRVGTLASATKTAYAEGADVRDLLLLVEDAQMQGEVSSLIAEQARNTVYAWQWIADRRRALA